MIFRAILPRFMFERNFSPKWTGWPVIQTGTADTRQLGLAAKWPLHCHIPFNIEMIVVVIFKATRFDLAKPSLSFSTTSNR